MPRNVEIKARLVDIDACEARAKTLADGGPTLLRQDDFFFHCQRGRLKLRRFDDGRGQLIHYERPNRTGPGTSRYAIADIADPQALLDVLTEACGLRGVVRKTRYLYRIGRTRVHIDRVEDLGGFVELEVVLAEDESERAGVDEAEHLMNELGIARDALVESAYIDLILAQQHG